MKTERLVNWCLIIASINIILIVSIAIRGYILGLR